MANNSNRKAIEFMVQGALPPHSTNVLWMDTSVPTLPVLKIFENGAWTNVHTGDSKAVELLAETVLAQQGEITELTAGVAKESTLTQGVQNIREDISHIDIDTSDLAKEATLGTSSDTSVSTTIFGWLKSLRDFLVSIVTTNPYAKETSVKDGNDTAISVSKSVYGALTDNTNGLSAIKNAIPTVANIQNGLATSSALSSVATDASNAATDAAAAKTAAQAITGYALQGSGNSTQTDIASSIGAPASGQASTLFGAIANLFSHCPVMQMTETTATLNPNVLYIWNEIGSLTLTLATPTDNTIVNEYMVQFYAGTNIPTITFTGTVVVNGTVKPSSVNNISILNGIAYLA